MQSFPREGARVSPASARSAKREHGRLGETAARKRGEWGQPHVPQRIKLQADGVRAAFQRAIFQRVKMQADGVRAAFHRAVFQRVKMQADGVGALSAATTFGALEEQITIHQ